VPEKQRLIRVVPTKTCHIDLDVKPIFSELVIILTRVIPQGSKARKATDTRLNVADGNRRLFILKDSVMAVKDFC